MPTPGCPGGRLTSCVWTRGCRSPDVECLRSPAPRAVAEKGGLDSPSQTFSLAPPTSFLTKRHRAVKGEACGLAHGLCDTEPEHWESACARQTQVPACPRPRVWGPLTPGSVLWGETRVISYTTNSRWATRVASLSFVFVILLCSRTFSLQVKSQREAHGQGTGGGPPGQRDAGFGPGSPQPRP